MPFAARVGDFHICPQFTGVVPHVGGPILPPGEPTVLIGGLPAARFTDRAVCVGPIDAINIGSSGVLINKLLAARVLDRTIHPGGMIVLFCPTVIIGEAIGNVTMVRRGNIFIIVDRDHHTITMVGVQEYSGTGASQAYVDRATASINSTWSGTTTFEGHTYTVNCEITGRLASGNPTTNQINVVHTTDPASVHRTTDPANQHYYGRGPGYQHSTEDDDGGLTIPHEFGHAMGVKDEYTEGPRNPDGTRSIVRTGPPGGLMGYIDPGSKPTPDNYNAIITGNGLAP